MKYVFIKKYLDGSTTVSIIDDPVALYKNGHYNEDNDDQLFQLGEEVKVEMNIKVKSKTTYRSAAWTDDRNLAFGPKTEEGYNG